MSWDPNTYENYGNYGNYNDQGYGSQQQGQQQDPYGQYSAPGLYDSNPPGPPGGGYYNPNDFSQASQQQPSQESQPQQPNMMQSNFQMPGVPDRMNPMVADMAMQYGQDIVGKGQEELKKNIDKYVSIGELKYYFAVDNTYVGKKLGLLLFPFAHSDWSIKYSQDEPVQPKFDINAPDLYIPTMAYVTYILVVGYILGIRSSFTPDLLATTASSALVWLILELGCIYLTLTLMNISTNLCKWDILSLSTYKYVGMIAILLVGLFSGSSQGFYLGLLYISAALAFFLIRTLKLRIEPEIHGMQTHGKRKLYMILFYAGLQPLLVWWMTSYFAPISVPDISVSP